MMHFYFLNGNIVQEHFGFHLSFDVWYYQKSYSVFILLVLVRLGATSWRSPFP